MDFHPPAVCGTYVGGVTVHCKNRLCEKAAEVTTYNGRVPKKLGPCPHCGFNTLSQFHMTRAMVAEMHAKLDHSQFNPI